MFIIIIIDPNSFFCFNIYELSQLALEKIMRWFPTAFTGFEFNVILLQDWLSGRI